MVFHAHSEPEISELLLATNSIEFYTKTIELGTIDVRTVIDVRTMGRLR